MAKKDSTHISRRKYLAASATGMAVLAGCQGDGDSSNETEGGDESEMQEGIQPGNQPGVSEDGGEVNPVLVNPVGYRPEDEKVAMVTTDAETFELLDEDDEVVADGELSDSIDDSNSGDTVHYADFTAVTDPGTYRLAVDNESEVSHEFSIEEGVWGQTLANVCRGQTLKRSGTEIDDDLTGFEYGPGHTHDAEALMYFGDEFHEQDEEVDVSGGWYDAGDYGKYIPSAAVSVGQHLLAYERNPDTFETDQLEIDAALAEDAGDEGLPDLLREAKFELEWMEKMQRPDGAVYLKVSGTNWPDAPTVPSEDEQTRYVFGLSTYGTAGYAGAMAMAARVYEAYDASFADRALENAEAAWEYLEANPQASFREDDGQNNGSNAYQKDTDDEERFWAAAELFRTTGDESYAEYVENDARNQLTSEPTPINAFDASVLGQWAYYSADGADGGLKQDVTDAFVSYADDLLDYIESEGYNVALTEDEYTWYSNETTLGKANILILANEMDANEAYLTGARDQIHYILGRSPTDMTYVTGMGENFPMTPHDRVRLAVRVHVPGLVVNGPNLDGGDPPLDAFLDNEDPAPAKAYLDSPQSWGSNETAITNEAALLFALADFTPTDAVEPGTENSLEVTTEMPDL